jgi:hypothetical protein
MLTLPPQKIAIFISFSLLKTLRLQRCWLQLAPTALEVIIQRQPLGLGLGQLLLLLVTLLDCRAQRYRESGERLGLMVVASLHTTLNLINP